MPMVYVVVFLDATCAWVIFRHLVSGQGPSQALHGSLEVSKLGCKAMCKTCVTHDPS